MKKVIQALTAIALLMILISVSCKKKPAPEPEDLNKHIYGTVTDYTRVLGQPNCRVYLYTYSNDGSGFNRYSPIAETFSDSTGFYEFHFTKNQTSNYAVNVVESPKGHLWNYFPYEISDKEGNKKEIKIDFITNIFYYYSYVKWHVTGDQGNSKCYFGHFAWNETPWVALNGQEMIFTERIEVNQVITQTYIKYKIENNNVIVKDTSYSLTVPFGDTAQVNIHF